MPEPVFIAANVREAELVERLLDEKDVEYAQRLEPVPHDTSNVCYQGILFTVAEERAEECRQLLIGKGLAQGVIPSPR